MYIDLEFYTNEYYGELLTEENFLKYADKASDKLDYLSNRNVPRFMAVATESEHDRVLIKLVKKATCEIAEKLYDIDLAERNARESSGYMLREDGTMRGKVVKSMSAGAESISYADPVADKSIEAVVNDKRAQNAMLYEVAREYLGDTGLLSQIVR